MRRIVTRNVRVSYYGSGHKCSIYFPFGHQQAKEQCNASVLFGEGEFETIEPLIFRCVENFQFFGWFGSKASCLKTLDASREEELRTTRLNRLNILDRLCRLDRLDRLCRLDRLNRLNRLDRLSRLDRLNRLNRLDRLNRLNNHMDTEPLQSSVSGPGQLASGDPSADMSQLHTEEDSLAGGDPPPSPNRKTKLRYREDRRGQTSAIFCALRTLNSCVRFAHLRELCVKNSDLGLSGLFHFIYSWVVFRLRLRHRLVISGPHL